MLFQTNSLAPAMLQLERLPIDEASRPHLDEITLVESEKLDKKVLSLEKTLHYCDETYSTIDDVLFEMANRHHINERDIIFSIKPQSVYFNEEVNGMVRYFLKEDIPFCLSCNMASREGRLLSELCTLSESMGSTEPIDLLLDFDFFNENQDDAYNGTIGEATGIGGALRGFGSVLKRGVRVGMQKGAEKFVDKKVFGTFLDSKDNNGNMVKNGRLSKIFGKGILSDFAGSVSDEIRSGLSSNIVRAIGKGAMSPQNLIDAIKSKIRYFENRMDEESKDETQTPLSAPTPVETPATNIPPQSVQKRNIFRRIIDKLKALLSKIIARLRGHNTPETSVPVQV